MSSVRSARLRRRRRRRWTTLPTTTSRSDTRRSLAEQPRHAVACRGFLMLSSRLPHPAGIRIARHRAAAACPARACRTTLSDFIASQGKRLARAVDNDHMPGLHGLPPIMQPGPLHWRRPAHGHRHCDPARLRAGQRRCFAGCLKARMNGGKSAVTGPLPARTMPTHRRVPVIRMYSQPHRQCTASRCRRRLPARGKPASLTGITGTFLWRRGSRHDNEAGPHPGCR